MAATALSLPAARTVRAAHVVAAGTAFVVFHLAVAATVEGGIVATLLPLALAVAFAAVFPRLRPGVASWIAFVVGAVALADGALHAVGGIAGVDDVTGL